MKLTPDSLSSHLEQQLLPAYLVSGDEPLLTGEAADAIRARARAAGFTERQVHFLERGSDWDDVRASAGNLSLFGARKVLELRLPSGRPGVAGNNALLSLLGRDDPDTLLIILAPRLDRDAQAAQWFRALESRGGWIPVWPVEADRLVGWLRARCRRLRLAIDEEALAVLAERTEGNLLAAHQELEKLRLLAPAGNITSELLASVADSARFDVFRLSEAVLEGEADRALRVLAGLRSEGTEQTLVLWALTKALRDLWGAVASPGAARGRGGWQRQTAALDKAARRAPRLPFRALALRAARADRMIKGRLQGNPWDEMALLATEICGRPAVPAPQSMFK
ncbi:MAG TPA: DNA polymerase III subunit delta [Steroidobacteraceae bacterium]|nr:DNA polymerase III subunit delta [Steroidobacteraceae bacterium]